MEEASFLDSVKSDIARYVGKTEGFALVTDVIEQCKLRLDTDEIVTLYEYIRNESGRLEDEWRDEFVEIFSNIEPFLPEAQY